MIINRSIGHVEALVHTHTHMHSHNGAHYTTHSIVTCINVHIFRTYRCAQCVNLQLQPVTVDIGCCPHHFDAHTLVRWLCYGESPPGPGHMRKDFKTQWATMLGWQRCSGTHSRLEQQVVATVIFTGLHVCCKHFATLQCRGYPWEQPTAAVVTTTSA